MPLDLPHMPLWVADIDIDRDCRRMNDAQFGRYMRLLIRQWIEGSVPADAVDAIRDACLDHDTVDLVTSLLDRKFSLRDGSDRMNHRCKQERDDALAKVEKNREAGRKGGLSKANALADATADAKADAVATGLTRVSDSDSVSDSLTQELKKELTGFNLFWSAWPAHPRKVGKAKCKKHWESQRLEGLSPGIIASLEAAKKSKDWKKDGGDFIPMPLSWLNLTPWHTDPSELVTQRPDGSASLARDQQEREQQRQHDLTNRATPEERAAALSKIKANMQGATAP